MRVRENVHVNDLKGANIALTSREAIWRIQKSTAPSQSSYLESDLK